jgi:hypothetical protein
MNATMDTTLIDTTTGGDRAQAISSTNQEGVHADR